MKILSQYLSTIILISILMGFISINSLAQDVFEPVSSQNAIRVVDNQRANNTPYNLVKLTVKSNKNTYKVGERMGFTVRGKQNYYLYVFNIDQENNKVVMLLPNKKNTNNLMKANHTYKIPEGVDFISDSRGTEKVIFVGTTQPLNFSSNILQTVGNFKAANYRDLSNDLSSKAIHIIDKPSAGGNNTVKPVILNINIR